nr:MAG TPA: hypothetical protein [Caudoviricetes sp.]
MKFFSYIGKLGKKNLYIYIRCFLPIVNHPTYL